MFKSVKTEKGNIGCSIVSQEAANKQAAEMDANNCRNCTNCRDCSFCMYCEACTNCAACWDCTNCMYCKNCADCWNCMSCKNCTKCTHCSNYSNCSNCTEIPTPKAHTVEEPKVSKLPKGVQLSSLSATFYQDTDPCQENDIGQELVVSTADAGGGNFLVIETKRWAINADEVDEFCQMLKDVLKGASND